jgi:hypothetical protein
VRPDVFDEDSVYVALDEIGRHRVSYNEGFNLAAWTGRWLVVLVLFLVMAL